MIDRAMKAMQINKHTSDGLGSAPTGNGTPKTTPVFRAALVKQGRGEGGAGPLTSC